MYIFRRDIIAVRKKKRLLRMPTTFTGVHPHLSIGAQGVSSCGFLGFGGKGMDHAG